MGTHYCNSCPDPVKVQVLDDYIVRVWFEDGKITDTDMKPELVHKVFARMKNKTFFSLVKIDYMGAITWPGELDFAPEHFYFDGQERNDDT